MKTADTIVNIGKIGYFHLKDKVKNATSNVREIDGDKLKNPEKNNKKIGDYIIIVERKNKISSKRKFADLFH